MDIAIPSSSGSFSRFTRLSLRFPLSIRLSRLTRHLTIIICSSTMPPRGTGNKKHPRQDETSEQLPAPKRPANSRQPSRQRSPSMTIQDDDVLEATPPPPPPAVSPAPLPTIELERRLVANETRLDSFVRDVETRFEEQGRHLTGQRGQNNGHDEDDDDAQRGNIAPKSPLQFVKKAFPWISESVLCDIVDLKLAVKTSPS